MTPFFRAEDIGLHVQQCLSNITKANGYETDLGARVFRGRRNIDDSAVPCAVVLEGPDNVADSNDGRKPMVRLMQRYVLAGYVRCNPLHPNDAAHAAIRDLKKAVFSETSELRKKVRTVFYRGRDIGPRADGVPIVFVSIDVDVEYVEDLTNP